MIITLGCITLKTFSQPELADSSVLRVAEIPSKYFTQLNGRINQYSSRITKKTTKTVEKLARWETKIKSLLDKTSPETSVQLFGEGKMTFNKLLQQMQSGQQTMLQYQTFYDKYRDDLTTSLMYVEQQKEYVNEKVLAKAKQVKEKMHKLNQLSDSTEAVQQFIKERKKELINTAFQYLGKHKYLSKINKEAWYYAEMMKNYKEFFTDEDKIEQTAKGLLNKIPAFQKFARDNSMLSSMLGSSGMMEGAEANLNGLQTRANVQNLILDRIAAGGPNAQQIVNQNIQAAQAQLKQLQDRALQFPKSSSSTDMPDFKPNMQKTKSFKQRLEYGSNVQFAKNNNLMPTTMDIAMTVGYKLNDKSIAGVGASYKMGIGPITNMKFSNQGLGFRSFLDWKLKKQFFMSGGLEMNYIADMPVLAAMQNLPTDAWQQSALVGVSKIMKIKTKWFKQTKAQLLYDFLARRHFPVSQPLIFRVGYNF